MNTPCVTLTAAAVDADGAAQVDGDGGRGDARLPQTHGALERDSSVPGEVRLDPVRGGEPDQKQNTTHNRHGETYQVNTRPFRDPNHCWLCLYVRY